MAAAAMKDQPLLAPDAQSKCRLAGHCPHCGHAIEAIYPGGVPAHLSRCWGSSGAEEPSEWLRAHPKWARNAACRGLLRERSTHDRGDSACTAALQRPLGRRGTEAAA